MNPETPNSSGNSNEELIAIIGDDVDAVKRSFEHLLREIAPLKETD